MKKILFALMATLCLSAQTYAQPGWGMLGKIRWDQLDKEVEDSLRSIVVDSLGAVMTDSLTVTIAGQSLDIRDHVRDYAFYVHPDMSDAQVQAVFDSATQSSLNDTSVAVIFKKGVYRFSTSPQVDNAKNISIYGNGAELHLNNTSFIISTGSAAGEYNYFQTESSGLADPSHFLSNMDKDSFYVRIADSTTWKPIQHGDALFIGDSVVLGAGYYAGDMLFFDKFATVNGQEAIYFQKRPLMDIKCLDSLWQSGSAPGVYKVNMADKACNINGLIIYDGPLVVAGFENVNISNMAYFNTRDTVEGVNTRAIFTVNNRNVNVSNYFVGNYSSPGLGYGFACNGFDNINITNFYAYNCRHAFTTNNNYHHWNHYITLDNYYIYKDYTVRGYAGEVSSHGNTYMCTYRNGYIEGASSVFAGRAMHHVVDDADIVNCTSVVNASPAGILPHEKKTYTLRNIRMQGTYIFLDLNAGSKYGRFELENVHQYKVDTLTYSAPSSGSFFQVDDSTAYIDSLIISNLTLEGHAQESASADGIQFQMFKSSVSTKRHKENFHYVEIRDSYLDDLWSVFGFASYNPVRTLNFHNNVVDSVRFFLYSSVSNADTFKVNEIEWTIKDNIFKNLWSTVWNSADIKGIDKLVIDNNIHEPTSKSISEFYRLKCKSVSITNNTFYKAAFNGNSCIMNNVLFSKNTMLPRPNQKQLVYMAANFANLDTVMISNNDFFADAYQLMTFAGSANGVYSFIGNNIAPRQVYAADDTVLIEIDSGTLHVLDNTFLISKDDGNAFQIIDMDGGTLVYNGNSVIFANTPNNSTRGIMGNAGTIRLGTNYWYNCPTEFKNMTGDVQYIPFSWYDVVVDSMKVTSDTLRVYKGATDIIH